MTRGTKGYQVLQDVSLVLVIVVAAWINVVNVETATAGASQNTTITVCHVGSFPCHVIITAAKYCVGFSRLYPIVVSLKGTLAHGTD